MKRIIKYFQKMSLKDHTIFQYYIHVHVLTLPCNFIQEKKLVDLAETVSQREGPLLCTIYNYRRDLFTSEPVRNYY